MPTGMLNRRRLLALLPAVWAQYAVGQTGLFRRKRPAAPPVQPLVYFGTDTSRPGAKGIYVARFDSVRGQFSQPTLAAATIRPSYLAMNSVAGRTQALAQAKHMLYAVNAGDAQTSGVSSFQMDPRTGALTPVGQVSSGGEGPCYIGLDESGHSAYVANYMGGTIASYTVGADGSLSQPVSRVDFHNKDKFGQHGPVPDRQAGPHPHSAMVSPDNRFLVVNDLGDDAIAIFPINPVSAQLGEPRLFHGLVPGSGPRHVAFHPNGRWVYGIDELSSRIDQYLFTATRGSGSVVAEALLTSAGHSISTLDPGYKGVNTAAEVVVSPNGTFVYGSNRGEDSLVVFDIDGSTGALKLKQRIACGGKAPRHFTLDPTGKWLVCGNQDSASVTVFSRHPGTGVLSGPVQTLPLESPMFTLFT